jgi:protein lifeguard
MGNSNYQQVPIDEESGHGAYGETSRASQYPSGHPGSPSVQPSAPPLAEDGAKAYPLPLASHKGSLFAPLAGSFGSPQAFTPNAYPNQGYQQGYGQPAGSAATSQAADFPLLHPAPHDADMLDFAERRLRQGFVRKVLGIVSVQLLLTLLVGAWIVSNQSVQRQLTSVPALVGIYAAPFIVLLVLVCSSSARHTYPLNLLLLAAFTVAESFAVGLVSSQYDTVVVLGAIGITASLTLSLTMYALVSKSDITMLGSALYAVLTAVVLASLANIFFQVKLLDVIISAVAAVLFCVYIVYDVQLLASGSHSSALSPDEYILGALNLYLDIINLFLYILRLLQYLNDQ